MTDTNSTPANPVQAICKTCGQTFDLSEEHNCPGLLPAKPAQVTDAWLVTSGPDGQCAKVVVGFDSLKREVVAAVFGDGNDDSEEAQDMRDRLDTPGDWEGDRWSMSWSFEDGYLNVQRISDLSALTAAIGAGRSSEPEFETAPDNGTPAEVLAYVLECARRWVPEARIIGNARAGDIERAIAAIGAGGQAVQDTWFTDRALPVRAMSGDAEDNRVLRLHFRRPVTDDDRKAMCDALNLHQASLTHPAPSGQAVAWPAEPTEAILDAIVQDTRASVSYDDARDIYYAILSAIAHPVRPGWQEDGWETEYTVRHTDGEFCASSTSLADAQHYALVYGQDGPVEVVEVRSRVLPAAPQPKGE